MGYEERWIECLEDIVSDVDKKIKRGHQRLAMTQEGEPPQSQASGPKQEQITQLTTKISMYLQAVTHQHLMKVFLYNPLCVLCFKLVLLLNLL